MTVIAPYRQLSGNQPIFFTHKRVNKWSRARCEPVQRWDEVELVRDLLGDWVVMRRWGSKASRRYGELSHVVEGEAEGRQFIEKIHLMRLRRNPAYWRVY
jgi:hypothetical protein